MALKTIGRGVFCDLLRTRRGMSGLSISVRFRRPYSGFGLTGCTSHSGRRTIVTCPAQETCLRPKYCYWTNPRKPKDPEAWLRGAKQFDGSWWRDWAQ